MTLVSTPDNPIPDGAIAGKIKTPDGIELRFARWDSLEAQSAEPSAFSRAAPSSSKNISRR